MFNKLKNWFREKIWLKDTSNSNFFEKSLISLIRQISIAIKGFKDDEVLIRSSALTFYTLISIVPIIAMAFGISKGFGFEEKLNELIREQFSHQEQVSTLLIDFSHSMLENTKGGLVAGFGFALLLYSLMKVLSSIELSFNTVWGIEQPRTLIRKFTEYTAIMIVAPLLIVFSSGITIIISSAAGSIEEKASFFELLGPVVRFFVKLTPYVLNWLLFAFLYMVIPNTKVKFKYALIAGVIAGTGFNLLEWAYFSFQIGVVRYNAIYGSFAALPLFLVWVQSSWIIVLFGGEISYAGQNLSKHLYREEIEGLSEKEKEKITFLILLHICRQFEKGNSPILAKKIAEDLKLPTLLCRLICKELIQAELLIEIPTEETDTISVSPKRNLIEMKIRDITNLIQSKGNSDYHVPISEDYKSVEKTLTDLDGIAEKSEYNKTLKQLIS